DARSVESGPFSPEGGKEMAVTITRSPRGPEFLGSRKIVVADILLDNSYPSGGYALTAQQFGGRKLESDEVVGSNAASAGLGAKWDTGNNKLLVFYPTGGGGAAPASLADPTITAGGTGQAPIIPGRGKEVANATNLTTITVKVRVTML